MWGSFQSICMAVKNREYFLMYYETLMCSSSNCCNFFWLDFPSLWNSFTPAYSLASQDIRNSGGLEANLWSRKVLRFPPLWAKYTLCRSMLTQTLERPLHKVRDGICKGWNMVLLLSFLLVHGLRISLE